MTAAVSMEVQYVTPGGTLTYDGMTLFQDMMEDTEAAAGGGLDSLSDVVLTSPANGQIIRYNGVNWINGPAIVLQTAVAAASQTSIDFTGVPSWANRITITPAGLSTNGTSVIIVQIGDSGGIETTAYVSTSVNTSVTALGHTSATAGFILTAPTAATDIASGGMVLNRVSGNLWTASSTVKRNTTDMCIAAGDKTLSDVLDRVRITTVGGVNTFDAGSVNIAWE